MTCDPKAFATLQARAALGGIALCAPQNDAGRTVFIAARSALPREFVQLDDVSAWIDKPADHHGEDDVRLATPFPEMVK
jgi:hypothetical protein